jgi:hypothetical protein
MMMIALRTLDGELFRILPQVVRPENYQADHSRNSSSGRDFYDTGLTLKGSTL